MNRNRFEKNVIGDYDYVPKEYNFPMFKVGDIVWILDEDDRNWKEFDSGKYESRRGIIIEGPIDYGEYEPWSYKVIHLDIYEDSELDDEEVEGSVYEIEQNKIFHKLSLLKKSVEIKCKERIEMLEDKIKRVKAQNDYIQEEVDVQEHREEQIDKITENA